MNSNGWVQLGKVTEVLMGQAPRGTDCNKDGHGTVFVKAGEFNDRRPVVREWTTNPLREARFGDVLVCVVGATAGKVNESINCAIGRSVAALRPDHGKLASTYLYHFLRTQVLALRAKSQGLAQGVITRGMLQELPICLPTLPDQNEIAARLDRAEALSTKRRAALARMDALAQAVLLDMFGDPATNPRGWPVSTVGEVARVQGGLQVTSARGRLAREVPYLRVANVHRGLLDLHEIKTIRATDSEIARTTLWKDDLLIVEGHGNASEIGRGALWDGSIDPCVHQNHLIRVRFDNARIAPLFACEYLNSLGGRRHLLRAGNTTSGLNTISVSDVRSAPLTLPPLGLQRHFASIVGAIEKLKSTHRASLASLDTLFSSLQHRAFRGEL